MSAPLNLPHDQTFGQALLTLARTTVAERFGAEPPTEPPLPELRELAATFVSIHYRAEGEHLHGCIGTIEPRQPLAVDVRYNAIQAAFHDPRTRPLRSHELAGVRFSISVLGPLTPLSFVDEADVHSQLQKRIDGLLFRYRSYRSVFLPVVWDMLPNPRDFLGQLKRKAGLPLDFWAPDIRLERFEVREFHEAHESHQAPQ